MRPYHLYHCDQLSPGRLRRIRACPRLPPFVHAARVKWMSSLPPPPPRPLRHPHRSPHPLLHAATPGPRAAACMLDQLVATVHAPRAVASLVPCSLVRPHAQSRLAGTTLGRGPLTVTHPATNCRSSQVTQRAAAPQEQKQSRRQILLPISPLATDGAVVSTSPRHLGVVHSTRCAQSSALNDQVALRPCHRNLLLLLRSAVRHAPSVAPGTTRPAAQRSRTARSRSTRDLQTHISAVPCRAPPFALPSHPSAEYAAAALTVECPALDPLRTSSPAPSSSAPLRLAAFSGRRCLTQLPSSDGPKA